MEGLTSLQLLGGEYGEQWLVPRGMYDYPGCSGDRQIRPDQCCHLKIISFSSGSIFSEMFNLKIVRFHHVDTRALRVSEVSPFKRASKTVHSSFIGKYPPPTTFQSVLISLLHFLSLLYSRLFSTVPLLL